MIEIYIVLKEGVHKYYLAKVERRGFDVFCFLPKSGFHHSLHESGESHIRNERGSKKPIKELPVILQNGEAGIPDGEGFICKSLSGLGCAIRICNVIISTNALSSDFPEFNKDVEKCFIIEKEDKELFPKDSKEAVVSVWAVPEGNKVASSSTIQAFLKNYYIK